MHLESGEMAVGPRTKDPGRQVPVRFSLAPSPIVVSVHDDEVGENEMRDGVMLFSRSILHMKKVSEL